MRAQILVVVAVLVGVAGCTGRLNRAVTVEGSDSGPFKLDGKPMKRDLTPAPDRSQVQLACGGACDYVFDRVLIPSNSTESQKYALNIGGKLYNSLGGILGLLTSQAPNLDLQGSINEAICAGRALHLLRLRTRSLTDDANARGQLWPAVASCCSAATCFNPTTSSCSQASQKACFSVSATHKPAKGYTAPEVKAKIKQGKLTYGPGKGMLYLPVGSSGPGSVPLLIPLKQATIKATVVGQKLVDGVLTGGVDQSYISNTLIPLMATVMSAVYTDPKTDAKTRELLRTLFDTNKDGKITAAEIKNNALIKTFLDGDVDVDGDGVRELSMGVGFSAVRVKITP